MVNRKKELHRLCHPGTYTQGYITDHTVINPKGSQVRYTLNKGQEMGVPLPEIDNYIHIQHLQGSELGQVRQRLKHLKTSSMVRGTN